VNPQGEGDMYTGFVENVPKYFMDVNNNFVTTTGNNISEFFTSRYSDQAKTERANILKEIKRPGATEASVSAVVLNNLHGASTFTGSELAEEVIPFLAGGGISAALKLGKAGLVALTGTAATLGDMAEVYGPSYAKAMNDSLRRGDDPATAHALASRVASGNTLVTLATEGPLNFMLAKSLLVGTVSNAAYTVGGNIAAQMASEYVESMAHNVNEHWTMTGKTPTLDDLNGWRGQATFEALIAGGTTSGMYVLAAAMPDKVVGKGYDGSDFTLADAITKPDQFDAKTLNSELMVTNPGTGKNSTLVDVMGDASTTYANGYSTEITESVISRNPAESLKIMQDMGLANWGPSGNITFSQDAGNIATAFISGGFTLPQADGTYTPTFGGLLVETEDGQYVAPDLVGPTPITPTTPPASDVTDVVDKTPALTDQSSSMKTAFETELARAVELGYRNEAAITEAVARTADALDVLPVNVLGTIGKTQDQLFTQYLPQVSVPDAVAPEVPATTPVTPPATPPATPTTPPAGGEVVSVDPDNGTALVVDGSGNVEVVDNTDGTLSPGDTVPTAPTTPVTPPTQTQPETGGGTQTGGVDFAEPPSSVVDPTLDDLLSGIGEEETTTPNLPAVIPPTESVTPTAPVTPVAPTTPDVSSQLAGVEARLNEAIAAAEDMGLSRDQAITAAVESVAAELGTTKTALLTQLGTTEAALRGEIAGVSADVQAKFNALTNEQKALATQLQQQGVDLNTAISVAAQQTQQQITNLGVEVDARINQLMQQGQTYQQATQQAIGELNQQNQQLQGLVGTQGRPATQADIDAIQQMLTGQTAVNPAYDVTGDNQVNQADIDFLTQVVGGTNIDWKPPVGSVFGPTGLYGQLATAEAQRQADLVAQTERERVAEEQRQRQQKISTAQQGVQSLMGMVPQMYKAAEETTTPLYSTMDYYNPFGDPFADTNMRVVSNTVPAGQTKMAQGGYLDTSLAEELSVDDLLNLLR
jgi:hypothetical protein